MFKAKDAGPKTQGTGQINNFEFLVLNYELYKVKTLGSGFKVQGSEFRDQSSEVRGSGVQGIRA